MSAMFLSIHLRASAEDVGRDCLEIAMGFELMYSNSLHMPQRLSEAYEYYTKNI